MAETDTFEDQIAALEATFTGATDVAATFEGELSRLRESMVYTGREVDQLASGLGRGLRGAFDDVVFDGARLSDALRSVMQSVIGSVYAMAMRPAQDAVGGVLAKGLNTAMSAFMPFAQGGPFSAGRVVPFAQGGVVSSPVSFPMRGATGLMGEAGPEAIMPLARGADGRLGVQAAGAARPVTVVMNISTPDVQGFQRSQSQIAAQAGRVIARGQRNR
ncbi:tail protein [Gemmobacter aquaticus]|uniref:Tail protein n=1 Tax=Gemmobacter aquaticus TaxID=490185 RepID=A0A918DC12_9RHOB|nr:phage tail tape measure protein [Gemmobacter aquaticus]GGO25596.1 tail protein [Gemmobacter aquaticus]